MTRVRPARARARQVRIRRRRAAVVFLALVVIAVAVGSKSLEPPSPTPTAAPSKKAHRSKHPRVHSEPGSSLGEAGGAVPDGTSVFDDEIPGVAKLDPALRDALRQAATDAAADGVKFVVDSGWRSRAYQEHLLLQAVAKYGSKAEAARWVATPNTSAHVSGDAVDIGPVAGASWLSEHGSRYGLCRIYGNEPWHYELRPDAIAQGCPPTYADPTHDPRMQR